MLETKGPYWNSYIECSLVLLQVQLQFQVVTLLVSVFSSPFLFPNQTEIMKYRNLKQLFGQYYCKPSNNLFTSLIMAVNTLYTMYHTLHNI